MCSNTQEGEKMKFRRHKIPDKGTLVLSRKAQLYFYFSGMYEMMDKFAELRDDYLNARTTKNINRITTFEIETMGLEEALRSYENRKKK